MLLHVCDRCGGEIENVCYGLLTLMKQTKPVLDGVELCELCCDEVIKLVRVAVKEPIQINPETIIEEKSMVKTPPIPSRQKDWFPEYNGKVIGSKGLTQALKELFKNDKSPKTLKDVKKLLPKYNGRHISSALSNMRISGELIRQDDKFYPPENAA